MTKTKRKQSQKRRALTQATVVVIARHVMAVDRESIQKGYEYKIIRSRRRSLCVEVKSPYVIVRSPLFLPDFAIKKFLREKNDWIVKHVSILPSKELPGIMFLGRRVDIIYSGVQAVSDETITIKVLGQSELEKSASIEKFYKEYTIIKTREYLEKYQNYFSFGKVKYGKYRSKWGSCAPDNQLNFNTRLSMCREDVIEYIVVHELCHTLVRNHSRKFYDEVKKYLPNYKESLRWLKRNRGLI